MSHSSLPTTHNSLSCCVKRANEASFDGTRLGSGDRRHREGGMARGCLPILSLSPPKPPSLFRTLQKDWCDMRFWMPDADPFVTITWCKAWAKKLKPNRRQLKSSDETMRPGRPKQHPAYSVGELSPETIFRNKTTKRHCHKAYRSQIAFITQLYYLHKSWHGFSSAKYSDRRPLSCPNHYGIAGANQVRQLIKAGPRLPNLETRLTKE